MKPSTLNVYELFASERRYVVPLYQRPYVWERESEWVPLWEDIRSRAEAVLHWHARDGNTVQPVRPHFLGALVTRQRSSFGREIAANDVIDGQQRLTTLQLFLAAGRDLLRESNARELGDALGKLTWHDGIVDSEHERLKVWPTNADREPFRAVLEAGSSHAVSEWLAARHEAWQGTPRMASAYGYFRDAIRTWLHDLDPDRPSHGHAAEDRQEALFEAIKRHLQVVEIALEDGDDPQVIFETLNARGRPLLPSDLVRNFVFTQAKRRGEDADALYEKYWKAFDDVDREPFWKEPIQFGRGHRERIVLFLFHFLTARTSAEFGMRYLYATFKRWWDGEDGPASVEDGLRTLQQYARAYRRIVVPEGTSRFDHFLRRLQNLEVTTFHPALLHLLVDRRLAEEDLDAIGARLESFLVRRQVCGLTSKNLNRIGLATLQGLKEAETVTPASVDRLLLGNGDGHSVRWPDDREFRQAWLHRPVYRRLRTQNVAMMLRALENASRTKFQESATAPDGLHVEHVMPRAWRERWPTPPANHDEDEPSDLARDRLVDTIGNLTLLTRYLNSRVSNGPFDTKRPAITRESMLRLNTYFHDVATWDESEIQRRGASLFDAATRIWPFPRGAVRRTVEAAKPSPPIRDNEGPSGATDLAATHRALESRDLIEGGAIQRGRHFVQVHVKGWWRSVHYEYLVDGEGGVLAIDVEFTSTHWARDHVIECVHATLPAVERAFPGYDVVWSDDTPVRRALQVRLRPEDVDPDRIADGLQRLMNVTSDALVERIRNLKRNGKPTRSDPNA